MGGCPRCGSALPSAEFSFCPHCGQALTQPTADQRKTVSILFCDLVDSTVLGSTLDTEVLRGILAQYWQRARMVVGRHGGTVAKFIGDAVVGVFGIPTLHEDDALRAVRAADQLMAEVADLNQDLQRRFGVELAARIGVNTGELLGGAGGEALMAGDAANVAARLQQAAAAGEVLLGQATHRLVRDLVDVQAIGPLQVKGKTQPLTAYRLTGIRPDAIGQVRSRRFAGASEGRGASPRYGANRASRLGLLAIRAPDAPRRSPVPARRPMPTPTITAAPAAPGEAARRAA